LGGDVDKLLADQTPKVVTIQDRSLGIVKTCLMVLIVVYVFIYSMLYKGAHFALSEVEGLARQQWQEPTMDWCNPSKVDCMANFSKKTDLPYCKKYTGSAPYEAKVETCDYYDARELPVMLPNGILIPTYIQTYKQKKFCHEGDETCRRKFQYVDDYGNLQKGQADGESEPMKSAFVVDVEDFTLTIDHSFRTTDGKVSYDDFLMQGRWARCDKEETNRAAKDWVLEAAQPPKPHECHTRPILCVHAHCDEMAFAGEQTWQEFLMGGARKADSNAAPAFVQEEPRKHRSRRTRGEATLSSSGVDSVETEEGPTQVEKAASAVNKGGPQVVSMKTGDVLTLKTLLAMAGVTMQDAWVDEDEGPQTVRSRGTAIVVHIHYDNAERWKLFRVRDPPWYTISVSTRPVSEFKHSYISAEDDYSRTLTWAYGIYVVIKQTGTIRTFNMVNALMTITAAIALLAMSNMLTDFLALNIMPRKDTYKELMYTLSDDMGGLDEIEEGSKPAES
jgi:hypothetical protein